MFTDGRVVREGTGAKVVQRAEVCNNYARSFAHLSLHVHGCQTKLSHFDAVACNTQQCPDRFHARRRAPLLHCVRQWRRMLKFAEICGIKSIDAQKKKP